jgi:hypothetical protein
MDGSAKDGALKQQSGRVIELVDQQARDMATTALTRTAVTTHDLARVEGRVLDRIGRLEAIAIVQLVATVIAIGVALALR